MAITPIQVQASTERKLSALEKVAMALDIADKVLGSTLKVWQFPGQLREQKADIKLKEAQARKADRPDVTEQTAQWKLQPAAIPDVMAYLSMNKDHAKAIRLANGLSVPDTFTLDDLEQTANLWKPNNMQFEPYAKSIETSADSRETRRLIAQALIGRTNTYGEMFKLRQKEAVDKAVTSLMGSPVVKLSADRSALAQDGLRMLDQVIENGKDPETGIYGTEAVRSLLAAQMNRIFQGGANAAYAGREEAENRTWAQEALKLATKISNTPITLWNEAWIKQLYNEFQGQNEFWSLKGINTALARLKRSTVYAGWIKENPDYDKLVEDSVKSEFGRITQEQLNKYEEEWRRGGSAAPAPAAAPGPAPGPATAAPNMGIDINELRKARAEGRFKK